MRCACIDIGSNTTRLLVAEPRGNSLDVLCQRRAFTHLGRELAGSRSISAAKLAELAGVVGAQVREARQLGATRVRVVATAAVRGAANRGELVDRVRRASGVDVAVLDPEEEAGLAFAGATRGLHPSPSEEVAVVDVGGGSTEVAVGTVSGGVRWATSLAVGSGTLTDAHLIGDPPSPGEVEAVREDVQRTLAEQPLPAAVRAMAVGGSATSLRRLVGPVLHEGLLEAALERITAPGRAEVARRLGLAVERVRLLPAGIILLCGLAQQLGCPLRVGAGGLREGVILELAAGDGGRS